jgi:hypothetical protein
VGRHRARGGRDHRLGDPKDGGSRGGSVDDISREGARGLLDTMLALER